jgi:MFS family permease
VRVLGSSVVDAVGSTETCAVSSGLANAAYRMSFLLPSERSTVQLTDSEGNNAALLAVAGGNFSQLGIRLLIGAVVPLLLVRFETSRATIGLALTGMWGLYALCQFPAGVLADRYGERRLVIGALAGTGLGTTLVAVAQSLPQFAAFVLVLGAGAGVFFTPASSLVSRLFPNQGRALGTVTAAGSVAGIVFPAVGGVVGTRMGWRVALGVGATTTLVALLGTVLLIPAESPENPTRDIQALVDYRRHWALLTRPSVGYSVALGAFTGFTFQAISSFFPTFLVEYHGLGTDVAGAVFGLIFGLSAVAQPAAGHVSDRYSRDFAIGISVTLAVTGLVVLLRFPTTAGLVFGVGFLGIGISWPGAVQARFFDRLSDDERGYGFGLIRTTYMVLASAGSVVVGALADFGGWTVGFGSVVVVLLTCLGFLAVNRRAGLGL